MKTKARRTCLLDKNEKEIHEFDVLRISYLHKQPEDWEVFYSNDRAMFELRREGANWTPWLWSEIRGERGENLSEIKESNG